MHGIVAALREAGVTSVSRAVVLGGGATARSALAALAALGLPRPGARGALLARRDARPRPLGSASGRPSSRGRPEVLEGCDLLVSTLPSGAADRFAPHVGDVPALLDVVYDPWPTPLAAACGGVVVSGAAMLLHQAAAQVRADDRAASRPLEAMRAALPALKP